MIKFCLKKKHLRIHAQVTLEKIYQFIYLLVEWVQLPGVNNEQALRFHKCKVSPKKKRKKNRYWLCIKNWRKKKRKKTYLIRIGNIPAGTYFARRAVVASGQLRPEPRARYFPNLGLQLRNEAGRRFASGRTWQATPALCGGARKRKKGEDEGREERKRSARIPPSVRTKNSRDSFALGHRQTITLCCIENCASADLDLQSRIAVSVKNGAIFFDEEMELCVCLCTRAKYKPPLPPFSPSGWTNAKLVG